MKRLRQAGIVPDLIAGDFDSLGFKPETGKLLCLPVEKDVTDSYAAAMSAADEGFERIIIFGGTGGRTEHTFANVQLLAALAKRGVKGFLADDGRTMFVSRRRNDENRRAQKRIRFGVFARHQMRRSNTQRTQISSFRIHADKTNFR